MGKGRKKEQKRSGKKGTYKTPQQRGREEKWGTYKKQIAEAVKKENYTKARAILEVAIDRVSKGHAGYGKEISKAEIKKISNYVEKTGILQHMNLPKGVTPEVYVTEVIHHYGATGPLFKKLPGPVKEELLLDLYKKRAKTGGVIGRTTVVKRYKKTVGAGARINERDLKNLAADLASFLNNDWGPKKRPPKTRKKGKKRGPHKRR